MKNGTYDIFKGDLNVLLKDLEDYKQNLIKSNDEIVDELSKVAYIDILSNASQAHESAQVQDISELTSRYVEEQGEQASIVITNPSPKVVFAEFGYGIVGKQSPYRGGTIFDMQKAGWQGYDLEGKPREDKGYDIDSKRKLPDRSWFYRDRMARLLRTQGEKPTHIWFNASQLVIQEASKVVSEVFERNLGNYET